MVEAGEERFDQLRDRLIESSQRRDSNIAGLVEEVQRRRDEAREQGRHFTAPTPKQLRAKLMKTNSPMIVSQSSDGSTSTPGIINYTVGINNPDPDTRIWLFIHLFVGPANLAPNVNNALTPVDERFPRLTEPEFDGLRLDPSVTASLVSRSRCPQRRAKQLPRQFFPIRRHVA
jgi:hypothetical protein